MSFKSICLFFYAGLILVGAQAQPTNWISSGTGSGGAVYAPSLNPYNSSEFYLSCDMGNIFRTTNGGTSFSMIPSTVLGGKFNSWVRYTESPLIRYTLNNQGGINYPVVSLDGGGSWNPLASNPSSANGAFQLYVDPANHDHLVISDRLKIYYSSNGGLSFGSAIYTTLNAGGHHLAGVFFDTDTIYVCTNEGLFKTSNNGTSWNASPIVIPGFVSGSEKIASFAGARSGTTIRFFCTTMIPPGGFIWPNSYGGNQVYFQHCYNIDYYTQSSWNTLSLPLAADRAYGLAMNPGNINTVYLAGQTQVGGFYKSAVFKTTNGGANWAACFLNGTAAVNNNQNISTGWMAACTTAGYKFKWINGTCESIGLDPSNINRVVITDKYAAYLSNDGGATWQQLQTIVNPANASNHTPGTLINITDSYASNGLETTVAYWLTWVDNSNLLAGYADVNLTRSADGGSYWNYNYSGIDSTLINDCVMLLKHPTNGKVYAATGDVPGSNGNYDDTRLSQSPGRIAWTNNNGLTWQVLKSFGRPVLWMALNPANDNQMYVAVPDVLAGTTSGIWFCNDLSTGTNWVKLTVPARTQGRAAAIHVLAQDTLVAVYTARDGGGFNYTASSGIFYSTDNGSSWTDLTPAAMQYDVRSLTVDPNDPTGKTWFACVGKNGAGTRGLYRTTDRGQNWTPLNTTMQAVSVSFHPGMSNVLYMCTQGNGLYYVTNTQATPQFTPWTSYPFTNPQRVFFNPYNSNEVWVASFGNGLRMGSTVALPVNAIQLSGIPNGNKHFLNWTITSNNYRFFDIEKSNDGHTFQSIGRQDVSPGTQQTSFSWIVDTAGTTPAYYRVRAQTQAGAFLYSNIVLIRGLTGSALIAYPNPAGDWLNISSLYENQVTLTDMSGKNLRQWPVQKGLNRFYLKDLPKGTYILYAEKSKEHLMIIRN